MQLTHFRMLPSPHFSLVSHSIESMRQLTSPKQDILDCEIVARLEVIRLIGLTAIELMSHLATAVAKIPVVVIQLPLRPLFGGVAPSVVVRELNSHLVRCAKLIVALVCIPFVGLVYPKATISLYEKLGLVPRPAISKVMRIMDGLRNLKQSVFAEQNRQQVVLGLSGLVAASTAAICCLSGNMTTVDNITSDRTVEIAAKIGIAVVWASTYWCFSTKSLGSPSLKSKSEISLTTDGDVEFPQLSFAEQKIKRRLQAHGEKKVVIHSNSQSYFGTLGDYVYQEGIYCVKILTIDKKQPEKIIPLLEITASNIDNGSSSTDC